MESAPVNQTLSVLGYTLPNDGLIGPATRLKMASKPPLRRKKKMHDIRSLFQSLALSNQPSGPSRLASLPREILLHTLEILSNASKLSLGLTCKDFWLMVQSEKPGNLRPILTGDDTYELLGLLSNDLPRHLPCYGCQVLHKREVDEFWCIQVGGCYKLCNVTRVAFPAPYLGYALSYEMLDLALRFDELSSDHGIPLTLLSHQCELDHFFSGFSPCKIEVLPRICEGRLLLRIDTFVEVDCTECPGDQAERLCCYPCGHVLAPVFNMHCALNIRFGAMTPSSSQWCAMQRCTQCATDASTRLVHSEDGTVVRGLLVRVWKDFGARGGCGKQPWTGHLTTIPIPEEAVYASGAKHLGHVFDGEDGTVEAYDRKISLEDVRWVLAGYIGQRL